MTIYKSPFEPVSKTYIGGIFQFIFEADSNPNYSPNSIALIDGPSGAKVSRECTYRNSDWATQDRAETENLPHRRLSMNSEPSPSNSLLAIPRKPDSCAATPSSSSPPTVPSTQRSSLEEKPQV
jgi:hypothetical protein